MRKSKSIILGIVLIAVAGVAAWEFAGRHSSQVNTSTTFFVDEETGEESVRSTHEYPPLIGKSGKPTVVQVFKFTCDGGKTVKIGYYSKYTDGMKRQLEDAYAQTNRAPNFDTTVGLLIRAPDKGSPWVHWRSAEGAGVLNRLTCPDGGDIETVFP